MRLLKRIICIVLFVTMLFGFAACVKHDSRSRRDRDDEDTHEPQKSEEVYPAMYERFGVYSDASTDVTLAIEDEGYEIAETSGDFVHLHDQWLYEWPDDYDCLTHEFAHVIQNGLDASDYRR